MTGANEPRERARSWRTLLALWAGPIAWLVQFCIGETLVDWPCFPAKQRLIVPLAGYGWSGPVALAILLTCAIVAFAAGWQALRVRRDVDAAHSAEPVAKGGTRDRARFLAQWGVVLGVGFGFATLITLVAFAMVPQCLG